MTIRKWGLIANPELDQQKVKGVYFFAGNWKSTYNCVQFYERPSASPNDALYTVHPSDGRPGLFNALYR